MYSLVSDLALDLILAINSKVTKEIPDMVSYGYLKEASMNQAIYKIHFCIHGKREAFCILEITVFQYDKELDFEVFAEYEEYDFEESNLDKISIGTIMTQYRHLRPIVTEGIRHYFDNDENVKDNCKSTARRTFKVRYTAITEYMEEKVGYLDSYGFEEMSNKVFLYIKSLYEIFKVIHPRT